ncbi:MAG: CPBP family glutamic-type intramembrane protease [Candidatus Omnitrophota bacterium]
MFPIFFVFLFLLVYYDARLLKKQNEGSYRQTLRLSEKAWAGLTILFAIAVVPVYLLRRFRFKKTVSASAQETDAKGEEAPPAVLSDALGLVIQWVMGMAALGVLWEVSAVFVPQIKIELGEVVAMAAFSSLFMLFLIYRTTRRYSAQGFRIYSGLAGRRKSFVKIVFAALGLGLIFAYLSSLVIYSRPVQPETPLGDILGNATSASLFFVFMLLALLMAPLCEELIFRGYFFHVARETKGQRFAVYFISFIFALLHVGQYWGDWLAIMMVAVFGVVLTLMRVWAGTTVASILTHYVYNIAVTFFSFFIFFSSHPAYVEYQTKYFLLDAPAKEELLLESLAAEPDFPEAYNDLAWLYAEEGKKLDEALELVEKALGYDPQRAAFWDTKAEVLYKLGRFSEAIEIEERLAESGEQNSFYRGQLKKFRAAEAGQGSPAR